MEKTVDKPNQRGRTAAQILAEMREPILLGLSRVLRASFASSVDELLERLLAERSWDIRQKIDDSLDLLRNGREGIEVKFDQACAEEWVSRTGQRERRADQLPEPKAARRPEPKTLSLSLVDDNQIGDQLTVGRIASRIRRRLDEEQVDGLRARFGLLLDRDWFSDNDFPIAPDVILECLRRALSAFGPAPVVAYLLDQFEPKLSGELATLYAEVNALMVKRGVMPEIRYHVAKPVGGAGFAGVEEDDGTGFEGDLDAAAGLDGGEGQPILLPGRQPAGIAAGQGGAGYPVGASPAGPARGGVAAGHPGGAPGPGLPAGYGGGHAGHGAPGVPVMPGHPLAAGMVGGGGGGGGVGNGAGVGYYPGPGGGVDGGRGGEPVRFFGADAHDPHARLLDAAAQAGQAAGGWAGGGHGGYGGDGGTGSGGGDGQGGGINAPMMMPAPAVRTLVLQLARRETQAQGSAARYLSDPSRFGARHANLPASSQPLIAALSVMQDHKPPEGRNVVEQSEKVREHSVEAAEQHGTPLERLIIETVSLVFDNVYEDPAIADTIKQQLLRLQVAAFKAALIDPSFFARPEHPMRQLIDRIAGMGSDPDFQTTAGSPLVGDVADLVTWILASFDRDLAVIEDALARLDTIVETETDRRADRLAKIATAAARTERLERTRDEVRAELTAVIRRSTPEFVARFIADQWTEVISRLRNGADYAPFDEGRARRTVEKLVWSVAPKKAVEIRKLAADLPQLIADLSRGLSFVATSEAERELFFSELLAWHGAAITEAKRLAALKEAQRKAGLTAENDVSDVDDEDDEEDFEVDEVAAAAAALSATSNSAARNDPAGDRRPGEGSAPSRQPVRPAAAGRSGADPSAGQGANAGDDADPSTAPRGRPRAGAEEPFEPTGAFPDTGVADDEAEAIDALEALDLVNGTEVELLSVKGEVKRFKLGWMSPARTVFIFSRYPKDHWTVRRPMLGQLLEQGRIRVVSRPAKTNQVIESLKAR